MIKAFIVVNNHAMVRLCRFYEQLVRTHPHSFFIRFGLLCLVINIACCLSLIWNRLRVFLVFLVARCCVFFFIITFCVCLLILISFYFDYDDQAVDKQSELCQTVYKIVTSRPDHLCSFVDDSSTFGPDTKLVYRHFATLYFCILSDRSESELAMLDLIQVYVETLDRVFENVCELDLIFNSPKAYTVLDETVVGGLVLEINSQKILTVYDQLQKLEKMHSSLIDKLQVGS
jgi:AP-3 complex subunit sigma